MGRAARTRCRRFCASVIAYICRRVYKEVMTDADKGVNFAELLARAGMTKAELARELGLTAGAVSRWGEACPRYAEAYLEKVIEANRWRP